MKYSHFQCRPFWIANCCPPWKNPGWVLIDLKSAYQNYPVYQFSCFCHQFEPPKNLRAMTNCFPTKSLQIVNLAAILDLKLFTNFINECLDYQHFIGYFQNAFVST